MLVLAAVAVAVAAAVLLVLLVAVTVTSSGGCGGRQSGSPPPDRWGAARREGREGRCRRRRVRYCGGCSGWPGWPCPRRKPLTTTLMRTTTTRWGGEVEPVEGVVIPSSAKGSQSSKEREVIEGEYGFRRTVRM